MPAQSFDVSATVRQLPSRCAKVQDAPLQTPSMAAEATALPPSPFAAYSGADSIQSSGTEKRRTPDRSEGPWPGNKYSCCESSVEEPGQIVSEAAKEQHVASAAAATAAQVPAEFEGAPLPANEAERMEMVHCMQVLDSPEDPVLNSLCTLLCSILKVPLAGVSIVDKDRLWFKAMAGMPRFEHPRNLSFCGWTLLPHAPEVLVVEDTREDRRFSSSPVVVDPKPGMPQVIFWAGCPLVSSTGYRLGSMCIIDTKPRKLQAEQYKVLTNFAEMAVRQLEKDHHLDLQRQANKSLLRTLDCFKEGLLLVDLSPGSDWRILYANEAWTAATGVSGEQLVQQPLLGSCQPHEETPEALRSRAASHVEQGTGFTAILALQQQLLHLQFRPAGNDDLGHEMTQVGVPSYVDAAMERCNLFFAITAREQDEDADDADSCSRHATAQLVRADSALARADSAKSVPGSTPSDSSSRASKQQQGALLHLQDGKSLIVKPGGSIRASFAEVQLGVLVRALSQGRIFRGRWRGGSVAVKVMAMHQGDCQRLGTCNAFAPPEAIMSVSLVHPHLVRGYKYAVATHHASQLPEGQPWVECWLVREWCGCGTLTDALLKGWLQRKGTRMVDHAAVLATAAEVASALTCLHEAGVIHGNLTSDSVWLARANTQRGFTAKVADFCSQQAAAEVAAGHPARQRLNHCPPELLLEGRLSKASDVYQLGVLLWEMSMQQRAWAGLSLAQIRAAILGAPKLHRAFPADASLQIQNIANLCMASNPEERPTAAMVQRFLSDLLLEQAPNNAARQAAEEAALTQPPDEPSEPPARVSGCNPLAWLRHARAKRPV